LILDRNSKNQGFSFFKRKLCYDVIYRGKYGVNHSSMILDES
jgi:hypothetical protein